MTDKTKIIEQTKNHQTNGWRAWGLTFLTFLMLPCLSFAAPDISVSSVSSASDSIVSVPVLADFGAAVNSIQFQLQFDPKLLTVSSVTAGSGNSSWTIVNNHNTQGAVNVAMFNPGTQNSAASGLQQQIAVIHFAVNKHPGDTASSSVLTLNNVIFDTTKVTDVREERVKSGDENV